MASGRDLRELQTRFGARAQQRFATVADVGYERSDIRDWDFGDLPEFVELKGGAQVLRGYPGLALEGEHLRLRLFDEPQRALSSHREGLLALFRIRSARKLRDVRRAVPELHQQMLWFSSIAAGGVLQDDIERAVLQAAFLSDQAVLRDADAFRHRLASGTERLLPLAVDIGRSTFAALRAWHALRGVLKASLAPQMIAAVSEVREQAQDLIYPGFVAATPLQRLPHLARYLRAARLRLEKLPGNTQRERDNAAILARFRQRYREAAGPAAQTQRLSEFRWMVEELSVSLFAQELGTADKVSPQRLDRLWAEVSAQLSL
jgi:ATP-dependent helicase HrpA